MLTIAEKNGVANENTFYLWKTRKGFCLQKRKNSMVPGVRIELTTPASSGLRSTTELPRHDKVFRRQF